MNKPVLVLVMSQLCGACQNFKNKMLPELKKELNNDSRFKFIIYDFPQMMIPVSNGDYHPELRNGFVKFFPTFILFPGNLWNSHKSKLEGVIKHGNEPNPKVDYSKQSIVSWINDTLKNNNLFKNDFVVINDKVPTIGTYNRFKNSKIEEDE